MSKLSRLRASTQDIAPDLVRAARHLDSAGTRLGTLRRGSDVETVAGTHAAHDPTASTAVYRGAALANSFVDSGATALFFDDASIPTCSSTSPVADLSAFYCPGP